MYKTTVVSYLKMISLAKYNCVGFDLDHTVLEYNVPNMTLLIYEFMADFLVSRMGYPPSHLKKPLSSGLSFLQKGLAMDFKRGNIVKFGEYGLVLRASHGTQMLTSNEISKIYGPTKRWDMAEAYCQNPFHALTSPMNEYIRCTLDNFDIPCLLVFGRAVDTIDELGKEAANYPKVWADILECIEANYQWNSFKDNTGCYFPALSGNPDKYLQKCPEELLKWLEQLKKNGKLVFLITGSYCDYASFTSKNALGPRWKDLFDFVVFHARKPGFFSEQRPYLSVTDETVGGPCSLNANMKEASQGSWKELVENVLTKKKGEDLNILYVGDNMLQDVLAPVHYGCCETLAICGAYTHSDENSSVWGSYFHDASGQSTFWNSLLQNTATGYVDSLSTLYKGAKI